MASNIPQLYQPNHKEKHIFIDLQAAYWHMEMKKDIKLWEPFWRCLIEHLLAVQLLGKCQW